MSEILIDCESEDFKGTENEQLGFQLALSLNKPSKEQPGQSENVGEDLLKICFRHSKPLPDEVKDYIAGNLGVFDLSENGDEKTLIFELKINDINLELIRGVFQKHFAPVADGLNLELRYSRTQTPQDWLEDLKAHSEIPFLLHLLQESQVTLKGNRLADLFEALIGYVKFENPGLVAPWMHLLITLASLKCKGTTRSFKKFPKDIFKTLELQQRDGIKDFFFLYENPINNYIFENGEPGRLQVSGRILNILNYEFVATFPNMQEFLKAVLSM